MDANNYQWGYQRICEEDAISVATAQLAAWKERLEMNGFCKPESQNADEFVSSSSSPNPSSKPIPPSPVKQCISPPCKQASFNEEKSFQYTTGAPKSGAPSSPWSCRPTHRQRAVNRQIQADHHPGTDDSDPTNSSLKRQPSSPNPAPNQPWRRRLRLSSRPVASHGNQPKSRLTPSASSRWQQESAASIGGQRPITVQRPPWQSMPNQISASSGPSSKRTQQQHASDQTTTKNQQSVPSITIQKNPPKNPSCNGSVRMFNGIPNSSIRPIMAAGPPSSSWLNNHRPIQAPTSIKAGRSPTATPAAWSDRDQGWTTSGHQLETMITTKQRMPEPSDDGCSLARTQNRHRV
ncbi:hypothetical protein ACLOJK_038581 [Asimina triloba]